MTQNFKGDQNELKMQAVVRPIFESTDSALDQFYEQGYNASDFLLMLYDDNRMPFSERIPRDAFVLFIREALNRFQFTGTFEMYLFILKAIFDDDTEILFTIPAPGKLEIEINATSSVEDEFVGREPINGSGFSIFNIIDSEGSNLSFRSIPGINNEYELNLLFSEIIPCGIVPTLQLSFIERFDFIGEDDSGIFDVIDNQYNTLIFYEIGA